MANFDYGNVMFLKSEDGRHLLLKGEVKNNSGKDYNAIALRVILYNKNIPMVNVVVVVNGVPNGFTKSFEKHIDEIEYDAVANRINRYEVYIESAY